LFLRQKDRTVALSDAILVLLTEQPMSGYDLAKAFDSSIGFFWTADHQQIYRELGRLKERAHVDVHEVIQTGRPNKLIYTITPSGLAALKTWSQRPSAPAPIKDDLLVRFYALEHVDIGALRVQLGQRLDLHTDRLHRFQVILERHYSGKALSLSQTGRLLGLRMGLRYEQACVEWCQEALQSLPESTGAAITSITSRRKPKAAQDRAKET
jgi:DNA-binding PadR family transcriptional regulator